MAVATERFEYVYPKMPTKLAWSAIFGGVFVTIGVWLVLYALGFAIGLTALNPENPESARGAGLWIMWWSIIAPIIAMFCGGLVAARSIGAIHRVTGALHGVVIWALTLLVAAFVFGSAIVSAVSGVVNLGGQALGAAGQMMPGMMMQSGQGAGINTQAILAPINERLAAEGKPTVTEQEFNAATKDVMQGAMLGRFDREQFVSALTQNTRLSREDAEQIAGRVETQVGQAGAQVRTGAFRAAQITAAVMWGITLSMLLQLAAAVFGASLAINPKQRQMVGPPTEPQRTAPPPREVYP